MAEPKGWFEKYEIKKRDGSPVDPDANYFVLRMDTDKHARYALRHYALSVRFDNKELAKDLINALAAYTPDEEGDEREQQTRARFLIEQR